MKVNKKFIFFILLIFGTFLLSSNFFTKDSKDIALEKKVMIKTIKKLKKEKDLLCIGFGGFGKKKIKISSLSFVNNGSPHNIDKARELMVYATEIFLNEFNSFDKIKPYLINHPFTSENIEIKIFFEDKKGNSFSSPNLLVVSLYKGKILYKTNEDYCLITVYEEPYERALNFIKKKNIFINKKSL